MNRAPGCSAALEQLVGSALVAGGVDHMLFDAGDFALQKFDPLLKLVDRQRAKIFLGELRQGALRAAGKEVVLIHGRNR